jgi:hypothetical protein
MIWMLLPKDLRAPNAPASFPKALDGDMNRVRLQDPSVDIGKWGISPVEKWACGRWVDPSHVPTRMTSVVSHGGRAGKSGLGAADYYHALHSQLVSDAFRKIVEAHDPGRHQFLPVQVVGRRGEWVGKDYFWMAPGNRVFAMDVDKTQPPMREIKTGEGWVNPRPERPAKFFSIGSSPDTWKPVFLLHEIGEADLFCDGEMDGYPFVTDRLRLAIEAAGLTGMHFKGPFDAH